MRMFSRARGFVLFCILLAQPSGQSSGQTAAAPPPGLVPLISSIVSAGNFGAAQNILDQYRRAAGVTPEYIEALSWIGRGELAKNQYDAAERNAAEVRKLCAEQLTHRRIDAEPHLPIALGASIEVQAVLLAQQNRRDEAVLLLQDEIRRWQRTSIEMRLRKNLNLLTLEGKPLPAIDVSQGIGPVKPLPLAAHRGHPVLLFLWAHWCADCKAQIAIVQKLIANYGPRGLVVVAPTQHYGYVAGGQEAPPEIETKYIAEIFKQYYSGLGPVEVPLSEANFTKLGVSTTPTLVLVDGQGIVRLYNPGNASYEALAAKIEPILRPRAATGARSSGS
jgi:thiol-disulfide isomerase/thioredoxin